MTSAAASELRLMASAADRYRTLLDASSAVAGQPTVKAVLHSLRGVLASTCALHGVFLYVLDDDGDSLHVLEFDREPDAPPIKTGTRISRIGAAAQVLEEQKPVFIPDVSQEMLKHPELAPFAAESVGRGTYVFPVSTSQQRYGVLVVTKDRGQGFAPEDVELLRSLASHVAVALECALARDRAELYQRQVMKERDRLRLLLEINNHIVSRLEVNELFHAVAASMQKHFGNEATAFWLINKRSGCLERRFLDFSTGRGFLEKVVVSVPTDVESEWWRLRTPQIYSAQLAGVPAAIREAARAESLLSGVSVPLVGADGPLGLFNMSSRTANAFGQADCDLLSQIGTQISLALDNALAYGRLRASHDDLQDQRLYLESEIRSELNFEDIVGNSSAIQNVMKQVAIVAPTDSTVLLHGETGSGKELVARAIHRGSPRRERTFVKLNCAAIPSGLLESELFGHEKGAFTGALMQKKGRFEIADHGTLFLDEIGDISLELQPKLLRAVQEQEFERLGSTKTIHVNVRIIAATHRDMAAMIRNNQFREDLFYRLNVFPIEIPPLRERRGDIPLLVHYFVSRLARRMQKNIKTIPKHAMEALVNASWPGNVRELENFIERAVILTQGSELNVPIAELKSPMRTPRTGSVSTFHDAERQAIIDALKAASGKLAGAGGAAERLGLKRTTLQNKMRRLQILRSDH
jgi:formate hydrogenlyase transcriptional activator